MTRSPSRWSGSSSSSRIAITLVKQFSSAFTLTCIIFYYVISLPPKATKICTVSRHCAERGESLEFRAVEKFATRNPVILRLFIHPFVHLAVKELYVRVIPWVKKEAALLVGWLVGIASIRGESESGSKRRKCWLVCREECLVTCCWCYLLNSAAFTFDLGRFILFEF